MGQGQPVDDDFVALPVRSRPLLRDPYPSLTGTVALTYAHITLTGQPGPPQPDQSPAPSALSTPAAEQRAVEDVLAALQSVTKPIRFTPDMSELPIEISCSIANVDPCVFTNATWDVQDVLGCIVSACYTDNVMRCGVPAIPTPTIEAITLACAKQYNGQRVNAAVGPVIWGVDTGALYMKPYGLGISTGNALGAFVFLGNVWSDPPSTLFDLAVVHEFLHCYGAMEEYALTSNVVPPTYMFACTPHPGLLRPVINGNSPYCFQPASVPSSTSGSLRCPMAPNTEDYGDVTPCSFTMGQIGWGPSGPLQLTSFVPLNSQINPLSLPKLAAYEYVSDGVRVSNIIYAGVRILGYGRPGALLIAVVPVSPTTLATPAGWQYVTGSGNPILTSSGTVGLRNRAGLNVALSIFPMGDTNTLLMAFPLSTATNSIFYAHRIGAVSGELDGQTVTWGSQLPTPFGREGLRSPDFPYNFELTLNTLMAYSPLTVAVAPGSVQFSCYQPQTQAFSAADAALGLPPFAHLPALAHNGNGWWLLGLPAAPASLPTLYSLTGDANCGALNSNNGWSTVNLGPVAPAGALFNPTSGWPFKLRWSSANQLHVASSTPSGLNLATLIDPPANLNPPHGAAQRFAVSSIPLPESAPGLSCATVENWDAPAGQICLSLSDYHGLYVLWQAPDNTY